jgi:hypothetical protein
VHTYGPALFLVPNIVSIFFLSFNLLAFAKSQFRGFFLEKKNRNFQTGISI